MGKEIERKFLVNEMKLLDVIARDKHVGKLIQQAYLRDTAPYVRVRVTDDEYAYLTIKSDGLVERDELELEIPWSDGHTLLRQCAAVLSKTRYHVFDVDHGWDIDVFHGPLAGLIVAEVELSSVDDEFTRPDWLGVEVTNDSRYSNVNLIKAPAPPAR